jgi:mannose/fructose/N-acetylgalactosamine-specific phosphotransferase system component IID
MTAQLAPLLLAVLALLGAVSLLRRGRSDTTALFLGITLAFVGIVCLILSAMAALMMLQLE